jgi:hypothetical protein
VQEARPVLSRRFTAKKYAAHLSFAWASLAERAAITISAYSTSFHIFSAVVSRDGACR